MFVSAIAMIDGGVLAFLILLANSGSLLVSVSPLVYQHTICFFVVVSWGLGMKGLASGIVPNRYIKIVCGIYNIYSVIYTGNSGGDLLG